MDTELAKLVLKQVTTFPESFSMGIWGGEIWGLYKNVPRCGTVACLAGHTMLLSGYRLTTEQERTDIFERTGVYAGLFARPDGTNVRGYYAEEAARLLGMTREERYGNISYDIFLDMTCGLARFTALAEQ